MGFLTNIVKKNIKKIIISQSYIYQHDPSEIDLIVRLKDNDIIVIIYSLRYREILNVLTDKEVEQILKN